MAGPFRFDGARVIKIEGADVLADFLRRAREASLGASGSAALAAASATAAAGQAAIATTRAASATASAQTSDAAKQAVLDNIAGINVQAGLTLQAVSRTALAAITDRPEGRQVFLSEARRKGLFVWQSGNQSALITSDPMQALYVAPASAPSGSAGCWVRILDNPLTYELEWWGMTPSFGPNGNTILLAAAKMLPMTGCTLVMPGYPVTVSASTTFVQEYLHVVCRPGFKMEVNVGTDRLTDPASYWYTRSMLLLKGTGSRVYGGTFRPALHASQNGGGFAISLGGNITAAEEALYGVTQASRPYALSGFKVRESTFIAGSEGIFCSPTVVNQAPVPADDIEISGCTFDGLDYQAVSTFFCNGVRIINNRIRMAPFYNVRAFNPNLRIIGSERVVIEGNDMVGGGMHSAVCCVTVAFGQIGSGGNFSVNPDPTWRICRDVTIVGNRFRGATPIRVDGCQGVLMFAGNSCTGDLTSTVKEVLAVDGRNIYSSQFTHTGGTLIFKDNAFIGFSGGAKFEGRVRRIIFTGNELVQNDHPADTNAVCFNTTAFSGQPNVYGYDSIEVDDNRFIMKPGTVQIAMIFGNTKAGEVYSCTRNHMPEDLTVESRTVFIGADNAAAGSRFINSATMDANGRLGTIINANSNPGRGNNPTMPAGTWAARVAS